MNIAITFVAFLAGLLLAPQLIAALYGMVDSKYAWQREYPRVVGRILFWSTVAALALVGLGSRFRCGCTWGLIVYAFIHAGLFALMKFGAARATGRQVKK